MKFCSGLRSVVLKQGLYISKYFKYKCTSRNISVINNDARYKNEQLNKMKLTRSSELLLSVYNSTLCHCS
jgi:hypothetical protein